MAQFQPNHLNKTNSSMNLGRKIIQVRGTAEAKKSPHLNSAHPSCCAPEAAVKNLNDTEMVWGTFFFLSDPRGFFTGHDFWHRLPTFCESPSDGFIKNLVFPPFWQLIVHILPRYTYPCTRGTVRWQQEMILLVPASNICRSQAIPAPHQHLLQVNDQLKQNYCAFLPGREKNRIWSIQTPQDGIFFFKFIPLWVFLIAV